jgi:hypothetical protein
MPQARALPTERMVGKPEVNRAEHELGVSSGTRRPGSITAFQGSA